MGIMNELQKFDENLDNIQKFGKRIQNENKKNTQINEERDDIASLFENLEIIIKDRAREINDLNDNLGEANDYLSAMRYKIMLGFVQVILEIQKLYPVLGKTPSQEIDNKFKYLKTFDDQQKIFNATYHDLYDLMELIGVLTYKSIGELTEKRLRDEIKEVAEATPQNLNSILTDEYLNYMYENKSEMRGASVEKTGKFIILEISENNYFSINTYGELTLSDGEKPSWNNCKEKFKFVKKYPQIVTFIKNDAEDDDFIYYYEI